MKEGWFRVAQKAALIENNKYLILKRSPSSKNKPNTWDFPGGKLEQGEDLVEGFQREVKEETGLLIRPVKPLFTFHSPSQDKERVFIVYLCESEGGTITLSNEHSEFRWATKEEILKLKISAWLRAFLTSNHSI